ncbi:Chitinase 1 [Mortierella sp. AM989]|nr:Chitinase 1 [Mortierella sp. AM989]
MSRSAFPVRLRMLVHLALLLLDFACYFCNAFDPNTGNNLVNYWGQNSYGAAGGDMRLWQKPLAEYCQGTEGEDVIVLAFLHVFNSASRELPRMDLSNQCSPSKAFPGTSLLHCPKTGLGVKLCQSKGKAVLLSLGGAAGAYGFSNDAEARDFAHMIWNLFLGGSSETRPLDDAVLDGIDLDIEGGSPLGYPAFIAELRSLFATDTHKSYYISAAPQCPFPDAYLGVTLQTAWIDMVFVQFYNNYCGTQAYGTFNFNFEQWDMWAKSTSINKNVKIYLGVPASRTAANAGYVTPERLREIVDALRCKFSSFGGIMMWDMSQSYGNLDSGSTDYSTLSAQNLKRPRQDSCAPGTYCTPHGCDFIVGPVKSCREIEDSSNTGSMKAQMSQVIDRMWNKFGVAMDNTWANYLGVNYDDTQDNPLASGSQHSFISHEAQNDRDAQVGTNSNDDNEAFLIDFIQLDASREFINAFSDTDDDDAKNASSFRTQVRIRTNGDAISPLWWISFYVKPGQIVHRTSRGTVHQRGLEVFVASDPSQEAEHSMVVRFVIEGVKTSLPVSNGDGDDGPTPDSGKDSFEATSLPDPASARFITKAY